MSSALQRSCASITTLFEAPRAGWPAILDDYTPPDTGSSSRGSQHCPFSLPFVAPCLRLGRALFSLCLSWELGPTLPCTHGMSTIQLHESAWHQERNSSLRYGSPCLRQNIRKHCKSISRACARQTGHEHTTLTVIDLSDRLTPYTEVQDQLIQDDYLILYCSFSILHA